MKTLNVWRADKPTAFREFIEKLSSKFSRVRSAGNLRARNFKLEAQFIASIELAQTFMQSTCFNLYSSSFRSLESTLGEAGLVDTVTVKVKEAVQAYIRTLHQKIDAKPSQYDEVLRLHPNLACPVSTEENMRIASETITRLSGFKLEMLAYEML
jgi:tryptophan 2,3-dioxygenase